MWRPACAGAIPIGAWWSLPITRPTTADPIALIAAADRVVTMTSGLGFEALIRGVPVTVLGAPFYAGWGLTTDLGEVPERRRARPSLAALVHATLIAYPRYHDPVTGPALPGRGRVERLADGVPPRGGPPPGPRNAAGVRARVHGLSESDDFLLFRNLSTGLEESVVIFEHLTSLLSQIALPPVSTSSPRF
jgi:hypothetical protein